VEVADTLGSELQSGAISRGQPVGCGRQLVARDLECLISARGPTVELLPELA
jgi:hypothetical protein